MSADMVNATHPPEPAGKRRKSLRWRQFLLVVLPLLVIAPVSIAVGYKIQHAPTTQAVAFSPDGHLLAAGSTDGTIRLRHVQNGTLLHTLSSETMKDVFALAFSPDGRTLASGASDVTLALWADQTVKLWDVNSGGLLRTLSG